MSSTVLEIASLSKNYHGLRPLRIERLAVAAGEQIAILGFDAPAAEMMTTLITGAALPDAGSIRLLGTATADIPDSDAWLQLVDRIGIVTDRAALLDSLSVVQNLAITFTLDIEPPPEAVRQRAAALAAEVGLPASSWDQPVAALDDSRRTRLRLARALSHDPQIVLMEHPTATVPRAAIPSLAADIRAIAGRRGMAALTLTADGEFAATVAERIVTWDPATGALRERRRGWLRRRR